MLVHRSSGAANPGCNRLLAGPSNLVTASQGRPKGGCRQGWLPHRWLLALILTVLPAAAQSLPEKARLLQRNLTERHLLDGLYVSIVPAPAPGSNCPHSRRAGQRDPCRRLDRSLPGGRRISVRRSRTIPAVRRHGADPAWLARAAGSDGKARTARPGLRERPRPGRRIRTRRRFARVAPGTGKYADYRFYSDVSVDNFNAVLYGTPSITTWPPTPRRRRSSPRTSTA